MSRFDGLYARISRYRVQAERRFWRWAAPKVAREVGPLIPRGIHIHGGISVTSDEPISNFSIANVNVRTGSAPGLLIGRKADEEASR